MVIKPIIKNYIIYQGSTFTISLSWTVTDLPLVAGCKAAMQIRQTIDSNIVISEATTENGKITIVPATGIIQVKLGPTETETFSFTKAVYDIEVEFPNGDRYRAIQGAVQLNPEVTRDV